MKEVGQALYEFTKKHWPEENRHLWRTLDAATKLLWADKERTMAQAAIAEYQRGQVKVISPMGLHL